MVITRARGDEDRPIFVLVYHGGIADVFQLKYPDPPKRIMQSSFHDAEAFCLGLKHGGQDVCAAWCNRPGDITFAPWNYFQFELAPFHSSFAWPGIRDQELKHLKPTPETNEL
jgi:hypothetical protein